MKWVLKLPVCAELSLRRQKKASDSKEQNTGSSGDRKTPRVLWGLLLVALLAVDALPSVIFFGDMRFSMHASNVRSTIVNQWKN